ncbi:MAG: hypothetical protein K2J62_09020 [Bacteroidales bacterium]|nr:hypothetical protein [Bacteroidales bacterium]
MARKIYPKGKALIEKFINTIGDYEGFKVIRQDSICQFTFDGNSYYAYFKCITHEGNPHPLEHQRAQLPQREEFNEIKESTLPFLFLGYDLDNDVFVCWEPHKIKPRLNKKSYVSFYSRLSAQQSTVEGKIKEEILTNGDKFVLFKRTDLIPFLQMIETHFPELRHKGTVTSNDKEDENQNVDISKGISLQGRIIDIREDESVRLLVDSYPEGTPKLTIIGECMNQFGDYYDKMQFSDWGKTVRSYLEAKFNE